MQGLEFQLGETADAIRDTTARFVADKITPVSAAIAPGIAADAAKATPRPAPTNLETPIETSEKRMTLVDHPGGIKGLWPI